MNGKERFFKTVKGEQADRTPVFPLLMSFAAKRNNITYRQFASDGAALAESQLKTQQMFRLDAITSCSDAFRISADLGGDIVFSDDKPPHISTPLIKTKNDFDFIKNRGIVNEKGRMADRVLATARMAQGAKDNCAVLGWVDMPFAEACSLCGVSEFMMIMYDEPELAHNILDFLTGIVIDFAARQAEVGADMIGCGDAAASLVSREHYLEFALPYEQRVIAAVHAKKTLTKLHICGNTSNLIADMVKSEADLFNVDHIVSFERAIEVYGAAGVSFKGNLDPVGELLYGTPETAYKKAGELIKKAKGLRYILSAGCEIPAETSDEIFEAFCRAAQQE